MYTVRYAKEVFTTVCEELSDKAAEMLNWGTSNETSGNLTAGERACLEALAPQLKVAAELFRQCSKNKEENDGGDN